MKYTKTNAKLCNLNEKYIVFDQLGAAQFRHSLQDLIVYLPSLF